MAGLVEQEVGDVIPVLAGALRQELDREDAAALAWIVPDLDGVLEQTNRALQRLTS